MASGNAGKAQYYKLVNQETDSDGERTAEKATVVPSAVDDGRHPSPQRRQKSGKLLPHHGWTTRATFLFFLLILGLALLAILVLLCLKPVNYYTAPPKPAVCTTMPCLELSGAIASMANLSADPCTDLWEYACGKLLQNRVLDDYISRWSWYFEDERRVHQLLRQELDKINEEQAGQSTSPPTAAVQAARLLKTCLDGNRADEEGLAPLEAFIASIGGWSAASWTANTRESRTDALAAVLSLQLRDMMDGSNLSPLVVVTQERDATSNVVLIKIQQSGLGMASPSVYLSNSSSSLALSAAYRKFMDGFADLIGKDAAARLRYRADMAKVYAFEVALAKIFDSSTALRDPVSTYNIRSLKNISEAVPEIDWLRLMTKLYPQVGGYISGNTSFLVQSPAYLVRLSTLLKPSVSPKEVLSNYISWMVVRTAAPMLSQELTNMYTVYKQALQGVPAEPRGLGCVRMVDKSLPLATGRLYIDKIFNATYKKLGGNYMGSILKAFKSNLPSVMWMDDATKSAAAEKVDAILYQTGYPTEYSDKAQIDQLYSQLNISTGSLFLDVLSAWRFDRQRTVNLFLPGQPNPRLHWDMRPTQVNAFYEPLWNAIGLPGALLQRPFFDPSAPAAFNYGGLGTVMGHELSHGFDDQGRQYDKDGNLRQWWSPKASQAFNERAQCVAEQYDNYTILGKKLNGELALGENIADIGGLKIAYRAYQDHVKEHGADLPLSGLEKLTGDQLYFLAHAQYQCSKATKQELLRRLRTDVHSALKWRVIGPSIDLPEFAAAFNCPADSMMNQAKRCSIW